MKTRRLNNIISLIVIFGCYCANRNSIYNDNISIVAQKNTNLIVGIWISLDSIYKLNIDTLSTVYLIESKSNKIVFIDTINNFSKPYLKAGIEIYTLKKHEDIEIRNYLNGFLNLIKASDSKLPLSIRFRKLIK